MKILPRKQPTVFQNFLYFQKELMFCGLNPEGGWVDTTRRGCLFQGQRRLISGSLLIPMHATAVFAVKRCMFVEI